MKMLAILVSALALLMGGCSTDKARPITPANPGFGGAGSINTSQGKTGGTF